MASIDPQTKQQVSLFHPREDDWKHHFQVTDGVIVGITPMGRVTARLLNMNAPRLVRLRRELIDQGAF